ncbi:MAG TPA: glycosyltransferase family 4 protein [Chthoniobacteraceae bacterium]|nr:glycosyltransferase family 4 protein [Chthoniobacteraceae bacterium]
MKITLLHYRYTPSLAGVELVMEAHARLLHEAGHEVTVVAASGSSSLVRVVLLPELGTDHPLFAPAQAELEAWRALPPEQQKQARTPGTLPAFCAMVEATRTALEPWCREADRVVVHNILTMPFHLPCTVALWELAESLPPQRLISWVHDLAPLNSDYPACHPGAPWPWALLSQRHPAMEQVAVSLARAHDFEALTGTHVDAIVPNGFDPFGFLNLTPAVERFAREHRLPEADLLLLHPTRLVRRKQIELGFDLLLALREKGCRAKLLITGAIDEHNPDSLRYLEELLLLRNRLDLSPRDAIFLHSHFPVTKRDLVSLYSLCDVLWLPSRSEGFGLPLLEGSLHRLLLFCTDIAPMNTLGLPNAEFFDPSLPPARLAAQLLAALEPGSRFREARQQVVRRFAWEALLPEIEAILVP